MRTLLRQAVLAAAVLLVGGAALADEQPADALTDARFYTGAVGSQGVFPGKLVWIGKRV